MRSFVVADLSPRGELQLKERYRYEHLETLPGAAELIPAFAAEVWREPAGFELSVTTAGRGIHVRFSATAATAGIATVRCAGALGSLSLLASGIDPQADALTLGAYQRHLLAALRDTGYEPAFDLLDLAERPLVATANFLDPGEAADRVAVAMADRCFAAAYFRFLGLA